MPNVSLYDMPNVISIDRGSQNFPSWYTLPQDEVLKINRLLKPTSINMKIFIRLTHCVHKRMCVIA